MQEGREGVVKMVAAGNATLFLSEELDPDSSC